MLNKNLNYDQVKNLSIRDESIIGDNHIISIHTFTSYSLSFGNLLPNLSTYNTSHSRITINAPISYIFLTQHRSKLTCQLFIMPISKPPLTQ